MAISFLVERNRNPEWHSLPQNLPIIAACINAWRENVAREGKPEEVPMPKIENTYMHPLEECSDNDLRWGSNLDGDSELITNMDLMESQVCNEANERKKIPADPINQKVLLVPPLLEEVEEAPKAPVAVLERSRASAPLLVAPSPSQEIVRPPICIDRISNETSETASSDSSIKLPPEIIRRDRRGDSSDSGVEERASSLSEGPLSCGVMTGIGLQKPLEWLVTYIDWSFENGGGCCLLRVINCVISFVALFSLGLPTGFLWLVGKGIEVIS